MSETELADELVDGVNAKLLRQTVEIRVARLHDGLVQIHQSVAAGFPVAVDVTASAAQHEVARIADGEARLALAQLKTGQRHERFERRTRRIHALESAVVERMVGRIVERIPVLRIDALDEQIRIETWLRYQRKHPAGGRLDGHQRTAMIAERLLGDLLQFHIERQREIVARDRKNAAQGAHGFSVGVGFNMFVAGDPAQLLLVALLESDLADVVGCAVVGRRALVAQIVDVIVADAADIADHVRGDLAVRIMAEQARVDFHARKSVIVDGDTRHFLVVEPRADRDAGEIVSLLEQFLEALAVLRRNLHQRGQIGNGLFQVFDQRWRNLQRIGCEVVRQHDSVAVQNQAAIRDHGNDEDAILFGQRVVILMLNYLHVEEAHQQEEESEQHCAADYREAQLEVIQLALVITKLDGSIHDRTPAQARIVVRRLTPRPGRVAGAAESSATSPSPATAAHR